MDAFGYNALSGFLGSSNIKSNKQQQLRYLDSILKSQERQQILEQRDAEASQKIIDESYQLALQSITGEHARPKDILDFKELSQSLLEPINEKIRQAGSYQKAKRLGIDQDLQAYAYKLNNNDKVYQMKLNASNYAKYFEAAADPSKANLFPISDQESINNYLSGKTDIINYRGHLDGEIKTDFIDEYKVNEKVTEQDYVMANLKTFASDYAYYIASKGGYDKNQERQLADHFRNNPALISDEYVRMRLLGPGGADAELPTTFGTAKIVTSLPEELMKSQEIVMGNGIRAAQIQEFGGAANYYKQKGLDIHFETAFGASSNLDNLDSKESVQLDAVSELFANDSNMKFRVLDAYLGDRLYSKRNGTLKIKIDDAFMEETYNYKGASLKGDVGFMDRTADDMEINGVFLGMKAVYTDQATGETKSKLLVKGVRDLDPTDRATYINKVLEGVADVETVKFEPAYIMQLNEPDILADDIYYHELNLGKDYFVSALQDENYDKQLSFNKNARAGVVAEKADNERKSKLKKQVIDNLNNIYATGDGVGIETLYQTHAPQTLGAMAINNIAPRMLPYFMADVFDMAQESLQRQSATNQEASFSNNVNIILNNFSKIAEKNPSLYQAYQSGNPSSLLEYYKENEKDKAKRKESVFKIWGKYFK